MHRLLCLGMVASLALACSQVTSSEGSTSSGPPAGTTGVPSSASSAVLSSAPSLVVVASSSASAAPPAAPPAVQGKPLLPFAELKELRLHFRQAAKNTRDCDGTIYKLSVDVEHSKWLFAHCEADASDPKGPKTLKVKNGELSAADRSALEKRYSALTHYPEQKDCGVDKMQLTLSLTKKDETSVSYVNDNWQCGALPEVVPGLEAFGSALELMVNPPVSQ